MIHYIADDLGIHRNYVGGESTTAVTKPGWLTADAAWMFLWIAGMLAAESAMDEWDS